MNIERWRDRGVRGGAALVGLFLCSFAPPSREALAPPFDRHSLVSDAVFSDGRSLGVEDLETFFRHSPYGRPSQLSAHDVGGRSAAEVIVREARRARLNPLLLVAKLQVEQSLVSRRDASERAFDFALGCNCPDGKACGVGTRGFAEQLRCGAEKLRAYFDELSSRGASRSLWRVGSARRAACGEVVAPVDKATASLYTYTPYVLAKRGGNWLLHSVFRRYAHYLGYYPESVSAPEPVAQSGAGQ